MNLKGIFVLILILLLVGVAVADAKSGGRGGRSSGSSSKSISSAGSHFSTGDAAKGFGIASVPTLTKSTKKRTHIDDDLFENETENESARQSPGIGVWPLFLITGVLLLSGRNRTLGDLFNKKY
jgi:hypothetical protein